MSVCTTYAVVDLDNTLIFTDILNTLAYNQALAYYNLPALTDKKRVTRQDILHYPQASEIISYKEQYFLDNLQKCVVNIPLVEILYQSNPQHHILWTRARVSRVMALLDYFNLKQLFSSVMVSDKHNIIDDVKKICSSFDCKPWQLIFYEDDKDTIEQLKNLSMRLHQSNVSLSFS